jgi:hypothetical protein
MLNVLNQFKRIYNDDGRNDKSFDIDETRLRHSLKKLKDAAEAVVRASQTLHDLLMDKQPTTKH